jgi:hypothetical protein
MLRVLRASVAAGILLILLPGRVSDRDARFDQPDAAGWQSWARRRPSNEGLNTTALYELAETRVSRLERFSSRIGRTLPASQPVTQLWLNGDRIVTASDRISPTGVLDAWTPLGPGNIGGRTRVLKYHPSRPSTIFAAGVSGGIWRTDDSGATWRPIMQGLSNIAVNSIVIDPRDPDQMFLGTGEGYFREDIRGTGLPLRGGGVFVSRDGGNAWRQLTMTASPDFYWVNDLEMGIGDSRRLYAATRTGVWRSTDGGLSWIQLLQTNVRGGCLDLAIRPDRFEDVLFASCGSYEQATVYRFARAATSAAADVVLREPGMGRTSIAIAPSAPDIMYALSASNDEGPGGNYRQGLLAVYRSDRGGEAGSWDARVRNTDANKLHTLILTNPGGATVRECNNNAPSAINTFTNMGWYNNVIAVDPKDANRVWASGVWWFRSDDGGHNWGMAVIGRSLSHVDQHAIAFHPGFDGQSNQTVLIGNDGGIYRSNNGRSGLATGPRATCANATISVNWESLNHGYGVTQFYHGSVFPDGRRYLGGAQDNGTILGGDDAGAEGWRLIFDGDGGHSAVNPANPDILYAQYQWLSLGKSLNGGATFAMKLNGLDPQRTDTLAPDANYLFVTPLTMDAADPQRLWAGGDFLYRTSTGADQWIKASTQLPDQGLASAIAIAPQSNGQHVMVGTHHGDILSSRDALAATSATSWPSARPREGWVTSLAFDPRDANVQYATYGNFGGAHVFKSINGGQTWTSIDGSGATGLPDIPTHTIVVDPDNNARLYLGTDLGVFVSTDGGATWMAEETGFGPTVTEWLVLMKNPAGQKLLFAFTHGRGVWRVEIR